MSQLTPISMDALISVVNPLADSLGAVLTVESATVLRIEGLPFGLSDFFKRIEIMDEATGQRIDLGNNPFVKDFLSLADLQDMMSSMFTTHLEEQADLVMPLSERIQEHKAMHLGTLAPVSQALGALKELHDAIVPDLTARGLRLSIQPLASAPWASLHIESDDPLAKLYALTALSPIHPQIGSKASLPGSYPGGYTFPGQNHDYSVHSATKRIAKHVGEYLAMRDIIEQHAVTPVTAQ